MNDNVELYEEWKYYLKKLREEIDKIYLSNCPTKKQDKANYNYEYVLNIMKKQKNGSYEKLLLGMYTLIPPARSDYYASYIYKNEKEAENSAENCIYIDLFGDNWKIY